ncbi:MAG: TraB/GumN family protein [Proteobacteria bacterium ST_bin14]|nr:MAG: TraB/GumN family protein [Proteobacteria bacterium ST_bin14]
MGFLGVTASLALIMGTPAIAQTAAPAPAPAAPATTPVATVDADPALWVVKDDDTTIYLFGTVHVLKPGLSWFDEGVKKAFDKSDELVLELIQPEPAEAQKIIRATVVDPDGPPLSQKLPEAERSVLAKALADNGLPAAQLEVFKPWFVALTLSLVSLPKLGYDPNSGAETILTAAAKAANKPISALETFRGQLEVFDTLPEATQINYLEQMLKDLPKIGETLDKMVAQWAKGDPDALAMTMNEGVDTPELRDALLTNRNIRWADWIDDRMKKPGTVFMAVGAGHLAGKDSVQVQLGTHKLAATRVKY